MSYRPLTVLLIALFAVRVAVLFGGYDHRPVVTSSDEIYWAEPAWAVLNDHGYTMPCHKGTVFDDLYATHPPVYVGLLAVGFKTLGMTTLALRGWGLAAHAASVVILLMFFRRLRSLRVFDDTGFAIASVLLVANFSTLSLARWGRPDPVCVFFAAVGFLVLVACRFRRRRSIVARAVVAGVFIGLAMLSHTLSVVFYAGFVYALFLLRNRLGWLGLLAAAAVPVGLTGVVWLMMYQDRVFEALAQHRMLASQMGGATSSDNRIFEFLAKLLAGDGRGFLQAGGTTSLLLLLTAFLAIVRTCVEVLSGKISRKSQPGWLATLPLFLVISLLVVNVTGLSITRTYYYFPIAVTCIGVLTSRFSVTMKRITLWFVGLIVVIELIQFGYYVYDLSRDYKARSPDRFAPLILTLPRSVRIAIPAQFWLQSRVSGLDIQLIDTSIPLLHDFWVRTPDVFREFDIVILPKGSPFSADPRLKAATKAEFPDFGSILVVYYLRPEGK